MIARTLIFAAVAAGSFACPAAAQDQQDRLKVVNCLDADRNLIRRVPLWRCKGEVVSDERAAEVKASRVRRAKGKMEPKEALYPGLRMVASGSGFFVSAEGHLLTNNHVVDGCTRISVKPTAERNHGVADVVGTDKPDDLAVIRYSKPAPAVAVFRKPLSLNIGDKVAVIGHPLHGLVAIKPIFVTGAVRSFQPEQLDRWGRFAIDADIRHGNSGGPVIDDRGFVIGVVSAKINTPAMFQSTGAVMRNIGIVIRQDRALRFLERFNIAYRGADNRPVLDDGGLFDLAQTFVARIGCWK